MHSIPPPFFFGVLSLPKVRSINGGERESKNKNLIKVIQEEYPFFFSPSPCWERTQTRSRGGQSKK